MRPFFDALWAAAVLAAIWVAPALAQDEPPGPATPTPERVAVGLQQTLDRQAAAETQQAPPAALTLEREALGLQQAEPEPTEGPEEDRAIGLGTIQTPEGFGAARLRAQPSSSAEVLEVLSNGTLVEILEGSVFADGFNWARGRTSDGQMGWVVALAVATEASPTAVATGTAAPAPTRAPPEATPLANAPSLADVAPRDAASVSPPLADADTPAAEIATPPGGPSEEPLAVAQLPPDLSQTLPAPVAAPSPAPAAPAAPAVAIGGGGASGGGGGGGPAAPAGGGGAAAPAPPAATGPAGFSFSPSASTHRVGDTFFVQIALAVGSQPVDGVQVRVAYDKTKLDVPGCQVTAGSALSQPLESRCVDLDSATGLIRYAAGQLQAPLPSGTFTVATITFRALAATVSSGTPLTFVISGREADKTQAAYGGRLLTAFMTDGTVVVE